MFTFLSEKAICRQAKTTAPIIGATCKFDAKIYKIVGGIFGVSPCVIWDKIFFQFSDFSF
jgi:hypothetical protein